MFAAIILQNNWLFPMLKQKSSNLAARTPPVYRNYPSTCSLLLFINNPICFGTETTLLDVTSSQTITHNFDGLWPG
ncbi:hypothetical protein R1flu_015440 [Riccia fluitans]|uniref:Uncharacterized protein n=1 Tax=Riccia fluitans TaxID=41844 RepID=A0ABD1YIZ7_9MARC